MRNKIILLSIIGVIVALSFYFSFKLTNKNEVIIKKNEIAVPQEFVLNPALQELSANIEGKLAEKSPEYFILESNGNKVKILIEPRGLTTFALSSHLDNPIKYEELKLGDELRGGVSIVISKESTIGMTGNRKPGDIIAHYFFVKNR